MWHLGECFDGLKAEFLHQRLFYLDHLKILFSVLPSKGKRNSSKFLLSKKKINQKYFSNYSTKIFVFSPFSFHSPKKRFHRKKSQIPKVEKKNQINKIMLNLTLAFPELFREIFFMIIWFLFFPFFFSHFSAYVFLLVVNFDCINLDYWDIFEFIDLGKILQMKLLVWFFFSLKFVRKWRNRMTCVTWIFMGIYSKAFIGIRAYLK